MNDNSNRVLFFKPNIKKAPAATAEEEKPAPVSQAAVATAAEKDKPAPSTVPAGAAAAKVSAAVEPAAEIETAGILFFVPEVSQNQIFMDSIRATSSVKTVNSPSAVFNYLSQHQPAVIMTEIFFDESEFSPSNYLASIKKQSPSSVIIICSNHDERRNGSDRRLNDIFEYIGTDEPVKKVVATIKRAFEFHKQLKQTVYTGQSVEKMRSQLEWMLWKQWTTSKTAYNDAIRMITNIKHFISQGMGVGALVTMVELLKMQLDSKDIELDKSISTGLFGTCDAVRDWLNSMDKVVDVISRKLDFEKIDSHMMNGLISQVTEEIEQFREIKDQQIFIEKLEWDNSIEGSIDGLEIVLREVLTNALKYSPKNSVVNITGYRSSNSYSLVILNDIVTMGGGVSGIPRDCENVIFEPFQRLNNTHDDRFAAEEIGFGLGLTVVQNILLQMASGIFLYEINDHTSSISSSRRIMAEIILPIANNR